MKAIDISGTPPGGKRTRLADALPLDTPYIIQMFPINLCNFACKYCVFSIPKDKRGFVSDVDVMDYNLYMKCIDDMQHFKNKIKVLRFAAVGEPLLHKNITAMIAYANLHKVTDKIELITNGSLLSQNMSDKLISAGLNRLIISINGTQSIRYLDVCGVSLSIDKLLKDIKYYHDHKTNNMHLHIKIADIALRDEEDADYFKEMFGDISDTIGIEKIVPIYENVKYEQKKDDNTQYGLPSIDIKVCPAPFYTMQINPDGKVVPCYNDKYPDVLGDCHNESIVNIWNGVKFNAFRYSFLRQSKNIICTKCILMKHRIFAEDVLDNDADKLVKFYEEKI